MAIAFVTGTSVAASAAAGATATTAGVTTTGGNLIVIAASNFASTVYVITDSKSNTYTAITNYAGGSSNVKLFYCLNPTVGSSHTFSGVGAYIAISAIAFSGAKATSALDQTNGAGSASNSATQATGSITPSEDNELLITADSNRGAAATQTCAGSVGYTTPSSGKIAFSAGNNMGVAIGYIIQTTLFADNATWTTNPAGPDIAATISSFKAQPTTTLFLPPNLVTGAGGSFFSNPIT